MPPRKKIEPAAEPEQATASEAGPEVDAAPQAAICGLCWPQGWPNDHAHTAHCEHGVWTR